MIDTTEQHPDPDPDRDREGTPEPRPVVWVNGRYLERDQASIPAFDAGFQHAVGLFETMHAARTADGRPCVFRLAEHLSRLQRSAQALRLTDDLRVGPLGEAVEAAVEQSGLVGEEHGARVRLTLTGGDLNMLQRSGRSEQHPTVMIAVTPAVHYPAEMFEQGVTITIAEAKANPFSPVEGHKTLSYWWRLAALQEASARGAAEALVLQVTNHVCGGAVSNLLAVRDGTLITPIAQGEEERGAMPSPVLPGVTRTFVIEAAAQRGIGCNTRMMAVDDILDADELFLTNSSWGVLPVVKVESKTIGGGAPGPVTRSLRGAWAEALRTESRTEM